VKIIKRIINVLQLLVVMEHVIGIIALLNVLLFLHVFNYLNMHVN